MAHGWNRACRTFGAVVLLALPGIANTWGQEWTSHILWSGPEKIQAVAVGDADPRHPGIEAVAVTNIGTVYVGGLDRGRPWSDSVYRHGGNMTGLIVADVDPTIDGREIYVGGGVVGEKRGEVVQLSLRSGMWRSRSIWRGPGFVHAIGLTTRGPSGALALIIPTYAGTLHTLAPHRSGEWRDSLVYRFAEAADSSDLMIKDLIVGPLGPHARAVAFCTKGGSLVLVDLDAPGRPQRLHHENGGIARLSLSSNNAILASCNGGNLLRVHPTETGWSVDTLFTETDQGRGVSAGRFRDGTTTYDVAIFGYPGYCRLLRNNGIGWDVHNVFRDTDKAHWMVSADIVPGNDSEELVMGGYSGRLILLSR